MKERVGFTTTIPVEILFAGGCVPCDLNNIFISDANPLHYIERAERDGFPKSLCTWIKGMYGVVMEQGIDTIIAVMEGDCSNTQGFAEILQYRGIRVVPFSYPFDRDRGVLKREIEKLAEAFGADARALKQVEAGLEQVRRALETLDRMTWEKRVVSGHENHLWLVQSSDMLGDFREYEKLLGTFIREAEGRQQIRGIPLGYIGVPPIIPDLYRFAEDQGAHIVYNETQRQFALPYFDGDLIDRYALYTYPYGVFARIADIQAEVKRRSLRGIIHYVQGFCFRIMEDIILKDVLDIPVLTIEGELPKQLDTRTKLRIEAFIEMLQGMGHGED
jgi:benzoyl-CoA reductase/2-hydroxyglutaryl-CoA dehydratase subunit BcrC/BadD/HgdB